MKGGTESHLAGLVRYLPEYGHQTNWLSFEFSKAGYRVGENDGYHGLGSFSKAIKYLKSFYKHEQVDLIHIHGISIPQLVSECFKLGPVVRSMHEPRMICPGHGKFWLKQESVCTNPFGAHCLIDAYTKKCAPRDPIKLLNAYKNAAFEVSQAHRYAKIIVMSEYIKTEAEAAAIPAEKLELLPYFVEPGIEVNNEPSHKVLYSGRLIEHKGVHHLIKAMTPLLKNDPDLRLEIVGEGYYRSKLERLAQNAAINNQIEFRPWQDQTNMPSIYASAKLVVLPSVYPEAFGIVGLEAMAAARPVVAFNNGGIPDWLKDGQNGYLVGSKDVEDLSRAISDILSNPKLANKMGNTGAEMIRSSYLPEVIIPKLIEVYETAVE